jgi:hypothetical protein
MACATLRKKVDSSLNSHQLRQGPTLSAWARAWSGASGRRVRRLTPLRQSPASPQLQKELPNTRRAYRLAPGLPAVSM